MPIMALHQTPSLTKEKYEEVVARRLGHTSVKTVLNVRTSVEGLDKGAADKLNAKAGVALARPKRGPEIVELPPLRQKTQR